MATEATYVVLFHHFRRVLEAAHEEGIDVAPLKGAHLLTSVYPLHEGSRPISDVDFLVRPRDWERTLGILRSIGMTPRFESFDESRRHEAGFLLRVGNGEDVLFEAHRHLFDPRRFPLDHDALWARSLPSTFDGVPCRRLSPEDHVVHVALHAAVHRLMQLASATNDVEALVRRGRPDLDEVVARAQEWRATRAVWVLFRLLADELPMLREAERRLRPPAVVRAGLELLVPDRSRTRLARLNHRVQAALLWPWLMDSPTQMVRFVAHHPLLVYRGWSALRRRHRRRA